MLEIGLEIPLDALAAVHDLNREHVFVLLDAADFLTVPGHHRHGFERRRHPFRRRPDLANQRLTRAGRADAREIRAEPAAGFADAMTVCALGREDLAAVGGVADRCVGRLGGIHVSQIRDDHQDVIVRDRAPLHFRTRHALANGLDSRSSGMPPSRAMNPAAIASRVEAVTIAAPHPVERETAFERIRVAQVGILPGGIFDGFFAGLPSQATAPGDHQQRTSRTNGTNRVRIIAHPPDKGRPRGGPQPLPWRSPCDSECRRRIRHSKARLP